MIIITRLNHHESVDLASKETKTTAGGEEEKDKTTIPQQHQEKQTRCFHHGEDGAAVWRCVAVPRMEFRRIFPKPKTNNLTENQ